MAVSELRVQRVCELPEKCSQFPAAVFPDFSLSPRRVAARCAPDAADVA